MENRVKTMVSKRTVSEVEAGFLQVGYECCGWVSVRGNQYLMRFDSRHDRQEIMRATTRMVGEGGFTWYLAAVMSREIRLGLLRQ